MIETHTKANDEFQKNIEPKNFEGEEKENIDNEAQIPSSNI